MSATNDAPSSTVPSTTYKMSGALPAFSPVDAATNTVSDPSSSSVTAAAPVATSSAFALPAAAPPSFPLLPTASAISLASTFAPSLSDSLRSVLAAGPIVIDSPAFFGPGTPHNAISRAATPPATPEAAAEGCTSASDPTDGIFDGTTAPAIPTIPVPADGVASFTCPHNPASSPVSCDLCGDPVAIDTTNGLAYLQTPVLLPMGIDDPANAQSRHGLFVRVLDVICRPFVVVNDFIHRHENLKAPIILFMIIGTIGTMFFIFFAATGYFAPERVQNGWVGETDASSGYLGK